MYTYIYTHTYIYTYTYTYIYSTANPCFNKSWMCVCLHVSVFNRYLAHLIPGVTLHDCSSVTTNKKGEKKRHAAGFGASNSGCC